MSAQPFPQHPEPCAVTVYHRQRPLDPTQADDLFISGRKVKVLGLPATPAGEEVPSEFEFRQVHGPDVTPEDAAREPIGELDTSR